MKWMHVRFDQNHMATTFEFVVSCESSRTRHADYVLGKAHQKVTQLENELSEFLPTSPVYALNHAPVQTRMRLSQNGFDLFMLSEKIRLQTQGAFDCSAKSEISSQKFGYDAKSEEIWRLDTGARLSFGAIGKGYALDQVRVMLESEGFYDYCLSAGGSSTILSGYSSPHEPWTWGWSWLKDESGANLGIPFAHQTGKTISVGVSGLHEKGTHLIDPRTTQAAIGMQSALVAGDLATQTDALSTAFFILGWENARETVLSQDLALASIDDQGVAHWNKSFERLWGPASLVLALLFFTHSTISRAASDEVVDFGALGTTKTFLPYFVERNPVWVLLPVFALFMLGLHLMRSRRPSKIRPFVKEEKNE